MISLNSGAPAAKWGSMTTGREPRAFIELENCSSFLLIVNMARSMDHGRGRGRHTRRRRRATWRPLRLSIHACYHQFTPDKAKYPLTSITSIKLIRSLKLLQSGTLL